MHSSKNCAAAVGKGNVIGQQALWLRGEMSEKGKRDSARATRMGCFSQLPPHQHTREKKCDEDEDEERKGARRNRMKGRNCFICLSQSWIQSRLAVPCKLRARVAKKQHFLGIVNISHVLHGLSRIRRPKDSF